MNSSQNHFQKETLVVLQNNSEATVSHFTLLSPCSAETATFYVTRAAPKKTFAGFKSLASGLS